MVANQIARGRAVAAATVAILLMTILPAPLGEAQTPGARDVFVVQGEAKVLQTTFQNGAKHTPFITNGTNFVSISVPVYNNGSAMANVPVYWYYPEFTHASGCVLLPSVPASTPQPGGDQIPGMAIAKWDIVTRTLPPGGHNLTVQAFVARPAQVPAAQDCQAPTGQSMSRPTGTNPATCLGGTVTCSVDTAEGNNGLRVYFVKEAFLALDIREIRWCAAENKATELCNTAAMGGETPYNVTPPRAGPDDLPTYSYFEVVVENDLPADGGWPVLVDYGSKACAETLPFDATKCTGFAYELNVSVTGPRIDGTLYLSRNQTTMNPTDDAGGHRARSQHFNLDERAGTYNVTVKLDGRGEIRKAPTDTVPDIAKRDAIIASTDFVGNFTASDLRTTAAQPYPYSAGGFKISGNVTFRNIGDAGTGGATVDYKLYLDKLEGNTRFVWPLGGATGKFTPSEAGGEQIVQFDWDASSSTGANYLTPGKHTIYAFIDSSDALVENNETNNLFSVDIYIADNSAPQILETPKIVKAVTGVSSTSPSQTTYLPLEEFQVYANVTDDDPNVTVTLNFTLDSNTSITRDYASTRASSSEYYVKRIGDFNFAAFDTLGSNGTENWTMRVRAEDAFGNNVTSAGIPLKLRPYPIHVATPGYVVIAPSPYPAAETPLTGLDPEFKIRVEQNMTGHYKWTNGTPLRNQQNYTGNLAYNITTAKNVTFDRNGSSWHAETADNCLYPPAQPTARIGNTEVPRTSSCSPVQEADNNTFTSRFAIRQDGAGAGLWNYSIRITDIAGHARVINGTLLIVDVPPTIVDANVTNDAIQPGQEIRAQAQIRDDENQLESVHLTLRRVEPADSLTFNLTITNRTDRLTDGTTDYFYNQSFKTGRGTELGVGGKFNATISAADPAGNWRQFAVGNLTIVDETAPILSSYGVSAAAAEIGENVTFWAKAQDATNVTVRLEVYRSTGTSELLFDPILLNESLDGNFTTTVNFSREAVHSWKLIPVDSVNLVGAAGSGTITVRDNLGPRYDVRSPSVVIDGTRYGSGTPRIEVLVFDTEGVVASSIDMKVAGLPVDFVNAPAPGNVNGYLVTYEVRANKKFTHGDIVEVNLTATDGSPEGLPSWLNFTFTVDDLAPTARLVKVAPSFRDQPAHVTNVSLASRFELAADDLDGMPTRVETIRYRILGGGPGSAETVYTGPFGISDAPGVYTGPRQYTVQFWAEDAVGNFNRNPNVTTVYVDDTPPALFQFFPQGRAINATFVDDRVGVNRSVVWYRANNDPYVPLPLIEKDGAWTLTLPEGVKGDKVSYYLQAWDKLDNTETFGNATKPYASFDVSNHEPKLRVTSPTEGARVFRTVDLIWEASDEDGDTLVFTVSYKAPGRSNYVELAKIENSATRRYTIDTTRFPDGQYTFRVAASDGGFVKLSEVTVTLQNRASAVGVVSIEGGAEPGTSMLVRAEITKAEALVEARLYLGATLVGSYPMNDEGREGDETANDGIFSVRVPVDAAGDYRVEIFTRYREDGELKESSISEAALFSSKLTPSYILGEYGAIIALIGLLAAVGIGVAVFVVIRRR